VILRFLNWIATGRRYFLIENFDRSPYLLRLLIRGYLPPKKGEAPDPKKHRLNIYLHRFFRHDEDRHLHSHPWVASVSIILWGGYIEEKRNRRTGKIKVRRLWPGMINILGPQDFHRILELKGRETWSLFITGGKAHAWGFLVHGIFVRAREYLASKGYVDEGPPSTDNALPAWLLTCACCAGRFPPPGNYYALIPGHRIGVRAPVCDNCARLPYQEREGEEAYAGV
jgi:hypothetical protein